MQETKRKRRGMTRAQMSILVGMGVLNLLVLGIGIGVALSPPTPASTATPKPTLTPIPSATRPPTWTPTPSPRPTRRPTAIPVSRQCKDVEDWLTVTRENMRTAVRLGDRLTRINWNNPDVDELVSLSNEYAVLATAQSMVDTTDHTYDLNYDLTESLNAFSLALWDEALAFTAGSQTLLDQAAANLEKAIRIMKSVNDRVDRITAECGIDL